jgi:phage anti-repressor protein
MNQIVPKSINFNELVQNSSTTLSLNIQTKLVQHLNDEFTEQEQQWYIANLFIYMNYHPTNDYPINLDNVHNMLGFANKENAKRTLKNNFILDEDYIKLLVRTDEQVPNIKDGKNIGGAGLNKETIMLNIDTFKNLCMLVKTDKGKQIRKYYVKLENIYNKLIKEEIEDQQKMLEEKNSQLEKTEKELKQEKSLRNKMLNRKWYDSDIKECVYVFVDNINDPNSPIKIGKSKQLIKREAAYSGFNRSGIIDYVQECRDCSLTEKVCHHLLDKYRPNKMQEFFNVSKHIAIQTIQHVIHFLDNQNIDESENENVITNENVIENENAITNKNENKPELFIETCCIIKENANVPTEVIKQAYRIWAKTNNKDLKNNFVEYMNNNFSNTTVRIENQRRLCYKNIELLPLKNIIKQPDHIDLSNFINDCCIIDWSSRISYSDLFHHFVEWKTKTNPNYVINNKEKKHIQDILDQTFFGGRVHLSSSTSSNHLFGVWGLGMPENQGLKTRKRTTKKVNQINTVTNHIINTWESITVASQHTKIPISTLSNYIRFGSIQVCPESKQQLLYKFAEV